ncbi:hypothetical protein [Stenotrophomonas phage StenR_269]|nr:hypothetical protein [Stenotrophomonas phage StenR_269]
MGLPLRGLGGNNVRMVRRKERIMITFENGIDARARAVFSPQVARFHMGNGEYRYVCIGTDYGYIHTSGGDVRTWKSYSGARRFLTAYNKRG